jgi:hypothetical protein
MLIGIGAIGVAIVKRLDEFFAQPHPVVFVEEHAVAEVVEIRHMLSLRDLRTTNPWRSALRRTELL